jgi:hypothetical protein
MAEREEIMLGRDRGEFLRSIAGRLKRSPSVLALPVSMKVNPLDDGNYDM